MKKFRDEFYNYLRNEIVRGEEDRASGELPFLLEHIKAKKEDDGRIRFLSKIASSGKRPSKKAVTEGLAKFPRNEKRKDIYVLLRESDMLRTLGYKKDTEHFLFAMELITSRRIRVTGEMLEKTEALVHLVCRKMPEGSEDTASKESLQENTANLRTGNTAKKSTGNAAKKCAALFTRLKEEKSLKVPPKACDEFGEMLTGLTEDILYEILLDDAKTFLYDSGRKTDSTMQMIESFFEREDAFFELEGYSGEAGGQLDEEKINDTKKLFEMLDGDPARRYAIVPVAIDPSSGMGLYIIGMGEDGPDNIMISGRMSRSLLKGHNCVYAIFNFDEAVYSSEFHPDDIYGFLKFGLAENGIYPGNRLEDACAYYNSRRMFAREDQALEMFVDSNNDAPEGCPDSFLKYFAGSRDRRFDEAVAEYIEEEKQLLGYSE